jgi:hypothetical protein
VLKEVADIETSSGIMTIEKDLHQVVAMIFLETLLKESLT